MTETNAKDELPKKLPMTETNAKDELPKKLLLTDFSITLT